MDVAKKLGLIGNKKYWRHTGQVEMKLNWLYNWIPALAIFVKHSRRVYDNEEMTKNINAKQDTNQEWVSSFFV